MLPSIYHFTSFGDYLQSYYQARNALEAKFSHRFLARELGDASPVFFKRVATGERRITQLQLDKLSTLFRLDASEKEYLRLLYLYSTTDNALERELFLGQMVVQASGKRKLHDGEVQRYYSHWRHSAIRVLLGMIDFSEDYAYLLSRLHLPVSESEARESIDMMALLRLIERDADGYWRPAAMVTTVDGVLHGDALLGYRLQCLDLGRAALGNPVADACESNRFHTSCFCVSKETRQRILERIERFRSEIRYLVRADEEQQTELMQLQLQLFKLSTDAT